METKNKIAKLSGWISLLSFLTLIICSVNSYNFYAFLSVYPIIPLSIIFSLFFGAIWLIVSETKNKGIIKWSLIRIVIYSIIITIISLFERGAGAREADVMLLCVLILADLLITIIVFVIKKLTNK
ncbi:MAG TPA: hypothetical protein PLD14_01725 [Candidatus Pacearchaeota archaeon]|nr:hypothetical protein [Candidatus Pacearchaeota archaeon]HPR79918.1 hypothetical protein [Candidatus Pacearchaeota archaeon]